MYFVKTMIFNREVLDTEPCEGKFATEPEEAT